MQRGQLTAPLEYDADRIAAGLLDEYRSGGVVDEGGFSPGILGFAVYAPTGAPIVAVGEVPAAFQAGESGRAFLYDPADGMLTLVRPVGMGVGPMNDMMRPGRGLRGSADMTTGRGGTILLKMNAQAYYRTHRRYVGATILAPLGIAGVAVCFLLLVASNNRYRRRAEEHETLARLGESSRTLALEIRNPLGAIRIQTSRLRRIAGDQGARELDVIDEEVERLNVLSRRVRDFLRSPGGQPEKIGLAGFLRDLARRSPYPLRLPASLPDASVMFDRTLLRSVVENLARNAWESHGDATGDRPVDMALQRKGARVILTVGDRGRGLPDDRGEKVFDPRRDPAVAPGK